MFKEHDLNNHRDVFANNKETVLSFSPEKEQ